MNAIVKHQDRAPIPTNEEPIPSLAGQHGLKLLLSATGSILAQRSTTEEMTQLQATCEVIFASLTPASTMEVGQAIEELALHYPVLRRTPSEQKIFVRHWVQDLEGYPADLIREACRQWRNSPKDRFPTPGQLKASIEKILLFRRAMERRARTFLDACEARTA